MTTRQEVADKALSYNGLNDGTGYPGPLNIFEQQVGAGVEYWCGIFLAAIFQECGIPLPSMQDGMASGYAYVPSGLAYGQAHDCIIGSWQAQPGDLLIIATDQGPAGHTEMVTSYASGTLYSVGGDSGPSNIDQFTGQGGVHVHSWPCPAGVGNSGITAAIDTSKLVTFSEPTVTKPPTVTTTGDDVNVCIAIAGERSELVATIQFALQKLGYYPRIGICNGNYGTITDKAIQAFQTAHKITPAGHFGPDSWQALIDALAAAKS